MNFKEMANLWSQYQEWLKQEGITVDNIQTKLPIFIQKLQENPENAQILKNAMQSPQGQQIMRMLNLTDDQISSLTNFPIGNNMQNTSSSFSQPKRIGNLTAEQMQQILNRRR